MRYFLSHRPFFSVQIIIRMIIFHQCIVYLFDSKGTRITAHTIDNFWEFGPGIELLSDMIPYIPGFGFFAGIRWAGGAG